MIKIKMKQIERCKSVIRLMLVRHDDLNRLKPYYSEYMIKKALKEVLNERE